jgi:hypothetical protein
MAQHSSSPPQTSQPQTSPARPNPIAVQKALGGVGYPTTRARLVDTARSNHADQQIVDLLARLPDHDYDSPTAVSKELARVH